MKHLSNFLIAGACVAAVAVLNFISAGLSNGVIQLPDPAFTTTLTGLIVTEIIKWLTGYEQAHGITPPPPNPPTA